MASDLAARRFLFTLFIGALLLVAWVFLPLFGALLLAASLAALFWPLNVRLAKRLGKKRGRTMAAGILTFAVFALIVGPTIGLSAWIVKETNEGLRFVAQTAKKEGIFGLVKRLPEGPRDTVTDLIERFGGERAVKEQVVAQGDTAAAMASKAVSATGSIVFLSAMMLIAFYFLLEGGEKLVAWADLVSPLGEGRTLQLLRSVNQVSRSVIKSEVVTAAVQSAVALVGYLIARVPNPVFFTAVTFIIAFIPAIGAGSVCFAAAVLMLVTGHPYAAIFLGIWALTAVALVDNFLKPFLIKDEANLHGAIVFFALLGGLAAFGAIGLLIGPLAVALLLSVIRMYRRDYQGVGHDVVRQP
jgi:predicted PurR-regulated permease PerM